MREHEYQCVYKNDPLAAAAAAASQFPQAPQAGMPGSAAMSGLPQMSEMPMTAQRMPLAQQSATPNAALATQLLNRQQQNPAQLDLMTLLAATQQMQVKWNKYVDLVTVIW